MSKFHINDKGNVSKCNATKGQCPFGSDDQHYSTSNEAYVAFEKGMHDNILSSQKKEITEEGKYQLINDIFLKFPKAKLDQSETSTIIFTIKDTDINDMEEFERLGFSYHSEPILGSNSRNLIVDTHFPKIGNVPSVKTIDQVKEYISDKNAQLKSLVRTDSEIDTPYTRKLVFEICVLNKITKNDVLISVKKFDEMVEDNKFDIFGRNLSYSEIDLVLKVIKKQVYS